MTETESTQSSLPNQSWLTPKRLALGLLAVVAAFPLAGIGLIRYISPRPTDLGVIEGQFQDCPGSPNCISTQANALDRTHYAEPITYEGNAEDAMQRLRIIVTSMPRTEIVSEDSNYLHLEFTSQWCRYIDDVELLIDPEFRAIEFRSASRIGYGDMGANRARMDAIRAAFRDSAAAE